MNTVTKNKVFINSAIISKYPHIIAAHQRTGTTATQSEAKDYQIGVSARILRQIAELKIGKIEMECTVQWLGEGGMAFAARSGSGHIVVMDGAPEGGGHNLAPRPMELILAGAGGCTAYDVVMILNKSRQDISGCEVQLKADRAETDPKVFTRIHFHFIVKGRALKAEAVDRAINLSAEKYCSASIMLGKTATITHDWEIVET